jgi:hypothetical protein
MIYGLVTPGSITFHTGKDIPDLDGKVIAITGGMSLCFLLQRQSMLIMMLLAQAISG